MVGIGIGTNIKHKAPNPVSIQLLSIIFQRRCCRSGKSGENLSQTCFWRLGGGGGGGGGY